jgi:hypothetical protein
MATTDRKNGVDMSDRVPSHLINSKDIQFALGHIVADVIRNGGIRNDEFSILYQAERAVVHVRVHGEASPYDIAVPLEKEGIHYKDPQKGISILEVELTIPWSLTKNNELLQKMLKDPRTRMEMRTQSEQVDGYLTGATIPAWHMIDLPHLREIEKKLTLVVKKTPGIVVHEVSSPDMSEFGLAFTLQLLDKQLKYEDVVSGIQAEGVNVELFTPDKHQSTRKLLVYRWPEPVKPIVEARLKSEPRQGIGHVQSLVSDREVDHVKWVEVLFQASTDEQLSPEDTTTLTTAELRIQEWFESMATTLGVVLDHLEPEKSSHFAQYELKGKKDAISLFLKLCEDLGMNFEQEPDEDVVISLVRLPRTTFGLLLPQIVRELRQTMILLPKAQVYVAYKKGERLQIVFDPVTDDEVMERIRTAVSSAELGASQ